jgi:hypothetical protein
MLGGLENTEDMLPAQNFEIITSSAEEGGQSFASDEVGISSTARGGPPLDMTSSPQVDNREVIMKVAKSKHRIGALISKVFQSDDDKLRPFAGVIDSYDEDRDLYKVVYEDGDAEELTYKEALSVLEAPVCSSEVGNFYDDRDPYRGEYPASQDGMLCCDEFSSNSTIATADVATTAPPEKTVSHLAEEGSVVVVAEQPAMTGGSFKIRPDNSSIIVETNSQIAMDEECANAVSMRTFIELRQRIEDNIEIVRKAAEERDTLMTLYQDKTTENASLSIHLIELSEKQALMSKVASKCPSTNKELERARTLKGEIVRSNACITDENNLEDSEMLEKQQLYSETSSPRRDAGSFLKGASSLSEVATRLDPDAVDLNEQVTDVLNLRGGGNRATEKEHTTVANLTPEPFGEDVSGSTTVTAVGEVVSKITAHKRFDEAMSSSAGFLYHLISPFLSTLVEVGEAAAGR